MARRPLPSIVRPKWRFYAASLEMWRPTGRIREPDSSLCWQDELNEERTPRERDQDGKLNHGSTRQNQSNCLHSTGVSSIDQQSRDVPHVDRVSTDYPCQKSRYTCPRRSGQNPAKPGTLSGFACNVLKMGRAPVSPSFSDTEGFDQKAGPGTC